MRNLLMALCLTAIFPSLMAQPITSEFVGGYGGINLGTNFINKTDYFTTSEPDNDSDNFKLGLLSNTHGTHNFKVSLSGGYNFLITPKFVFGIEGRLLPSEQFNTTFQKDLTDQDLILHVNFQNQLKFGNTLDLLVKPGILITNNTMVYGLAGLGLVQTTIQNQTKMNATDIEKPSVDFRYDVPVIETTKTLVPLILGAGVEHLVTPNLSLTGEINHAVYPNLSTSYQLNPHININFATKSIYATSVLVGVNYHF